MTESEVYQHLAEYHRGQLPGFEKRPDITWSQVHRLLHRLFKWRGWTHTA